METFAGSFAPTKSSGGVTEPPHSHPFMCKMSQEKLHGAQIRKGNMILIEQHADIWPMGEKGRKISHKEKE